MSRSLARITLATALIACQEEPPAPPTAPDMTPLITAYETPTADFGQGTIDALADTIESTVSAVDELLDVRQRLEQLIDEALGAADGTEALIIASEPGIGTQRQALSIDGAGYVRIHHICHGFGDDAPVNADENGTAELYVTATENGLDPVIWGTASQCKYTLGGRDLVIDGDIRLYIGDLAQIDSVRESPILFDLDLTVTTGSETLIDSGLDFRVCPTTATTCEAGRIELRMAQDNGAHIVFFIDASRATGGVRGRSGTWACAFSDGVCQNDQGDTVSIPALVLGGGA